MQLRRVLVSAFALTLIPLSFLPADPGDPSNEIRFTDITKQAGLIDLLAGIMGHGAAAGDFDGDGRIDLYVGGFCDRPNAGYRPAPGPVGNRLLRNLGGDRFKRVPQPAVETLGRTSGAVFADLDNDGDLDLFVANNAKQQVRKGGEPQPVAQTRHCQLFRNDGGHLYRRPHAPREEAPHAEREAYDERSLLGFQEIGTGYGYASGQPAIAHFGLDRHQEVDVRVKLPNGKVIDRSKVKANQVLIVEEP